eukprot:gb/GECH01002848.1/.p1 GENE.gb/GECH01002848.1/~~gb/GECH01002848.1/.p1  ORF type:complete len:186 (+),score=49.55 gb/GECH01002848.1/:1-558(+)
MVSALVPIAPGSEEIESVCIIDTLRRAGITVTVVSVAPNKKITASRKVVIEADDVIDNVKDKTFDIIALPGGKAGAEGLRDCDLLIDMLKKQKSSGRIYAAICASPGLVFSEHNLIDTNIPATSHPSVVDKLPNQSKINDRVVVHENCVTSRGPGTAIEFALKLIELTLGVDKRQSVADPMLSKE